ncbi:urease accessory protein UreD [Methylophaga sp.]|uniref:urease accessory protein UreD n=1 Tax=Methylophaga sp. TaxID=2024840 RepID=UPI003F6A1044
MSIFHQINVSTNLTTVLDKNSLKSQMSGWDAHLNLGFGVRAGKTRLTKREHKGPLVFQKVLYPEGILTAHGLIIHPPGGVAGGDKLHLHFDMDKNAQTLLTTPGATKWYKSAGRNASQHIQIHQQQNTLLEWLPQENIVFDGAAAELYTTVYLETSAVFASWEITCLGRKASGEVWQKGSLKQVFAIERDRRLIWHDSTVLKPDSPILSAKAGMRNHTVFGTVVIASGKAPEEIVEACRQVTLASDAFYGVSALPEIFTARYIGNCAQEARTYFEALWACLRPWYGDKKAVRPRIWAT